VCDVSHAADAPNARRFGGTGCRERGTGSPLPAAHERDFFSVSEARRRTTTSAPKKTQSCGAVAPRSRSPPLPPSPCSWQRGTGPNLKTGRRDARRESQEQRPAWSIAWRDNNVATEAVRGKTTAKFLARIAQSHWQFEQEKTRRATAVKDSSEIFFVLGTIIFLFLFGNYSSIIY